MFSAPITIVCNFAVSAAEASSRLLQALIATIAEKPRMTAARFLGVV
jgi:plasmid stabilization system protein ParE